MFTYIYIYIYIKISNVRLHEKNAQLFCITNPNNFHKYIATVKSIHASKIHSELSTFSTCSWKGLNSGIALSIDILTSTTHDCKIGF